MNVLIACEESQRVCKAFRENGHKAFSNDIVETSGGRPEWHLQMDALEAIKFMKWDLMVAFPPCTFLSVVGNKYRNLPSRFQQRVLALEFINKLMFAPISKIAIENPVGEISTCIRKPDQIIHPYQFGERFKKRTCIWVKNLPLLQPTEVVTPLTSWVGGRGESAKCKSKERSKTFYGIARAMANQWG